MSTIGEYSVFIGNSGWTYGFTSLKAARTFVAGHEGKRYDIHKGAKLVESGKVHPPTPGSGGKVWLVQNPRGNPRSPKYAYVLRHPGNWQDGTFKLLYADQAKQANREAKTEGENRVWVRQTTSNPAKKGGAKVKIFGKTFRVGSKAHAIAEQQKKHFEDLQRSETGYKNPALYSVYSDDGLLKEGFKTLGDARAFAKRMAIDQNTYVYRNEDRLTTYKMKFPKSRNPLPAGRWVKVKARRLRNGRVELRGTR
jgi:hypothetical protein